MGRGEERLAALRAAQLEIRARKPDAGNNYANPDYWAGIYFMARPEAHAEPMIGGLKSKGRRRDSSEINGPEWSRADSLDCLLVCTYPKLVRVVSGA